MEPYVRALPLCLLEHMEEDDETPRALPRWVELEYNVCFVSSDISNFKPCFPFP